MPIKSFADTSAVSLSYVLSDAADSTETLSPSMNLVPYTTEGFTMSKEAKSSQAISGDRRIKGSKNTKGTAAGALTLEFGATPFCLDMLQAALMNTWTNEGGYSTIHDGEFKQYFVIEKTIRPDVGADKKQSHERYYGNLVNDTTIELGDGELITMAVNTMAAFADYDEALQGVDGSGGSIASTKVAPESYEIADSSNNLQKLILTDSAGTPLEMTFSTASLAIENNVREQPGIGHVFSAGMGMGKVGVSLSGDVYYYDQTVLDMHMRNERMKGSMEIETEDGKFEIFFPNMAAQSPTSNAGGENQDYTTSLTLTAEEGEHEGVKCCIFIKYTPANIVVPPVTVDATMSIDDTLKTVDITGTAVGAADSAGVNLVITDSLSETVVASVSLASEAFEFIEVDIATLGGGELTATISVEKADGSFETFSTTGTYTP
jgi:hypothetical protein